MPQRFVYNARTGQLSGITTMRIGDPQVTIEEFVTSHIENNKSRVYDSDLVAATIAKNFDTAGPFASFDSDQVVAIINENVSVGGGFDSDQIVSIINEHMPTAMADSDYSAVAILRNDLESDRNHTGNKFIEIRNLVDSESGKVAAIKRRVQDVEDNDSDKTLQISALFQRTDSDGGSLAGVKRFVRGENASPNNIFEYYSASGQYGSNPFHDSDLVIASALKGINTTATYDSDRVVTTIITAGEIALKDYFLDSDEVFNMGSEHGWFFDSDKVMESVTKNINSTITISGALDNLLDSEEVVNMFVEHQIATQGDIDSEIALIKTALDSETSRIQLLLSNADSDQIEIAKLRVDADSDTTVIQALKTQAETDAAQIILIRNDLDSDTTAIQALNTRIDSDYARTNTRFGAIEGSVQTVEAVSTVQNSRLATLESRADSDETNMQLHSGRLDVLESRADSDETILQSLQSQITSLGGGAVGDSDLKAIADLRNDVDSDFTAFNTRIGNNFNSIQTLNSTTNSQGGRITLLEARRDSESAKVQTINGTVATLQATQNAYGGRITSLESRADSDEIAISKLRADLDSDSQKIQTMSGQIGALEAGTFDDSQLVARLDSDQTAISALRRDVDSDSIKLQALEETVAGVNAVEVFTVTLDSDVSSIGSPSMGDVAFVPYRNVSGRGIQDTSVTIAGGILYAGGTYQFAGNAANKGDLEVGDVMIAQTNTAAGDQAWVVTSLGNNADEIIVAALDSDQILEVWVNDLRTNHTTVPITPSVSGTNDPMRASPAPKFYSGWTSVSNVPGSNPAVTTGVTLSGSSGGITHYMPKAYIHDSDGFDIELIVEGTDAYPEHKVMRRQDVFDSDQIVAIINENTGASLTDSDLKAIADLRNDVDSDSIAISARLPLAGGTMSGDIDGNGNKVLFANVYPNFSDLPNATTYHGMFAHVHATGAGYFAHAGNWVRLSNYDEVAFKSDLDSETARIQLLLASTDSDALSLAELRQSADSDANTILILRQNAESDSAAIQALQSSLGPRLDSDELKIQALDTELSNLETSLTARLDSDETAIQSVRTDMDVSFNVVNSGASAYTFTGDGFPAGVNNPTLYLNRGHTYNFIVNASGHPFQIRLSSGGSAYSDGVTNNGAQVGLVKFVVPMNAPESLVYQCTVHGGMVGTIRIGKQGFDSDQIASMILENAGAGITDSDLKVVADLRNDLDSEILVIRQLRAEQDSDSQNSGGSGGGSSLTIQDEGSSLSTAATTLNFVGSGVTASGTGAVKTITISGGGGSGSFADSDLKAVADLRNDVDSDSAKIQSLQEQINNLDLSSSVPKEVQFTTFKYKAVQGQTTFSGVDRDDQTLAYTVGRLNVFLNGVLINDSDDYTATNGTSVVLALAADSDDVVVIQKYRAAFDSEAIIAIMNANLTGMADSDLKVVADLRNDLDSDRQNKDNVTLERFDFTATQGQATFTGADNNGSTLSYIANKIQVFLNGILMLDGTDYTANNGTSVVLVSSADSDDKLSVIRYLGIDATASDAVKITRFTYKYGGFGNSTVGDSDITGPDESGNTLSYTVGKIQVYSNGILLEDSDDYIATDGSTITLRAAPDSDDVVSIFKYLGTVQQGFDSDQVVAIVNENTSSGLAGWTAPTDSEYQLVAGQQVILDTSAWPRSVILPSSATLGDEVRVLDGVGMAATYPITVSRNGHRIMGDSDDMTVNTDNAGFALVYYNATYGWRLKEN